MVTADDARTLRSNKGVINHETYKIIYERVQHRIQYAAKKGYTQTDFTIPPIVPGRPMYELSHAVRYTRDKLRYNGFEVTEVDTDVLQIDWKPKNGLFVPSQTPPPATSRTARGSADRMFPDRVSSNRTSASTGGRKTKLSDTLQNLKAKLNIS